MNLGKDWWIMTNQGEMFHLRNEIDQLTNLISYHKKNKNRTQRSYISRQRSSNSNIRHLNRQHSWYEHNNRDKKIRKTEYKWTRKSYNQSNLPVKKQQHSYVATTTQSQANDYLKNGSSRTKVRAAEQLTPASAPEDEKLKFHSRFKLIKKEHLRKPQKLPADHNFHLRQSSSTSQFNRKSPMQTFKNDSECHSLCQESNAVKQMLQTSEVKKCSQQKNPGESEPSSSVELAVLNSERTFSNKDIMQVNSNKYEAFKSKQKLQLVDTQNQLTFSEVDFKHAATGKYKFNRQESSPVEGCAQKFESEFSTEQSKQRSRLKKLGKYKLVKANLRNRNSSKPPPGASCKVAKVNQSLKCAQKNQSLPQTCVSLKKIHIGKHKLIKVHSSFKQTPVIKSQQLCRKPSSLKKVGQYKLVRGRKSFGESTKQTFYCKLQPHTSPVTSLPVSFLKLVEKFKRASERAESTNRTTMKKTTSSSSLVMIGGILYRSSKNKLNKHSQPVFTHKRRASLVVTMRQPRHMRTLFVRGIPYRVGENGMTLRREKTFGQQSETSAATSLGRIDIGGVTYVQSQPGMLVKKGNPQTVELAHRAVNRSIYRVRQAILKKTKQSKQYCIFYNRYGKCNKERCRFLHDPSKIVVCTRFLRGTCKVDKCPFSHEVSKNKMPVCSFFLRGVCGRDLCPYLHVNVGQSADVCDQFLQGTCSLGEKCKKKHILYCPEYTKTGNCPRGSKCRLVHYKNQQNSVDKKRQQHEEIKEEKEKNTEDQGTVNNLSALCKTSSDTEVGLQNPRHSLGWDQELPSFISLTMSPEVRNPVIHKKQSLKIRPQLSPL